MTQIKMIRIAAVLIGATCLPCLAFAEDETEWIVTATGVDKQSWEVKQNSLMLTETKSKVPMSLVVGRVVLPDDTINIYRWYVTDEDCSAGYGKLAILDISGNYIGESDYLKGAGTLASATAEAICDGAAYVRSQKGI